MPFDMKEPQRVSGVRWPVGGRLVGRLRVGGKRRNQCRRNKRIHRVQSNQREPKEEKGGSSGPELRGRLCANGCTTEFPKNFREHKTSSEPFFRILFKFRPFFSNCPCNCSDTGNNWKHDVYELNYFFTGKRNGLFNYRDLYCCTFSYARNRA